MIRRLRLPDSAQPQLPPRRSCVPTFNVLHRLLQRNFLRGRDDQMEMIGHNHELVEFEFPLAAIKVKRVNEEFGGVCIFEKRVARVGHGCDKESPYLLRGMSHV